MESIFSSFSSLFLLVFCWKIPIFDQNTKSYHQKNDEPQNQPIRFFLCFLVHFSHHKNIGEIGMSADSLQVKQYKAYIEKLKEANEEQLKVIELQNKMIENQELIIFHKDEEIELLEKQMDHLLKRIDRLLGLE